MENVSLQKDGGVAIVTITRAKKLNALNTETLKELSEIIDQIGADAEIKAVVLTGEGEKAFVAGADIAEMKDMTKAEGKAFGTFGNNVFLKLEQLEQPVIAAINGYALGGGCELAMACDIRIASETAKFSQPEVGLGITPGFGGTQRLPRIVGSGRALELLLTGRRFDAQEALSMGLVNKVVPLAELMNEALKMAKQIAGHSQTAIGNIKKAVYDGLDADFEKALAIEETLFGDCFETAEQKEAMEQAVAPKK